MSCNYQQIVVIGSGRVASRALQAVVCASRPTAVVAVEPEAPLTEAFSATCRTHSIAYSRLPGRNALIQFFDLRSANTLIISAHNVFLFPAAMVADGRFTIVNFHNSLLPRHRGRNAPSWTIFEQDAWAGITWHRVTAEVDAGDVLCQRRIRPDWNETALTLTQICVDLGIGALVDMLPPLLSGSMRSYPQDAAIEPSFHRARDIPNQGILDANWPLGKAWAFLRAVDFGKLPVFPPPRVKVDGREYLVTGYRLAADGRSPRDSIPVEGRELHFQERGRTLTVALAPAGQAPMTPLNVPAIEPAA
ncbi:MAG TPA: formyltransferase family protein [Planctomycetaceae bacterium]|nr:formyltransferase family protein [Planctomycetaceae bacterium]